MEGVGGKRGPYYFESTGSDPPISVDVIFRRKKIQHSIIIITYCRENLNDRVHV